MEIYVECVAGSRKHSRVEISRRFPSQCAYEVAGLQRVNWNRGGLS